MQWTEIIVTLAGVIATLGGWEGIRYLLNRRSEGRKAEADAEASEFSVLKEVNGFLQEQLKEQTEQVRTLNKELLTLTNDYSKLALKEQTYHCDVKGCQNRQPPNGY